MANQPEKTPNIYTLLIGIDGYKPNRLYKNLKGAVRDINLVASYLLETLKIPSERIFKLTSPNPEVAETIETKDPEPTYENIVAQFNAITKIAQPGEQVYIYYSGHGGRATTIYPDLKGADQNDEAIVPMDIGAGGRYLLDVELATLLKRMTDKGLIVTLIMDCCHSGGATRGDAAIRSGDETDKTPPIKESLVAKDEELIKNWKIQNGGLNGEIAGVPPANNYVLLAACRPNEYAYEYTFDGKERQGALTYWLIQTLATSSTGLSFRKLYDRVCAQIQSKFPQQLPMLIGDGTRAVFGNGSLPHHYSVTVMSVDSKQKQVTLNAGLAQGLSSGTRFAIYPLNATDFSNRQQQLVIVELEDLQASTSVARILELKEGGIGVLETNEGGIEVREKEGGDVRGKIEPGAPAVMVSAPVALVRRVRLFDEKEVGDKEHELAPEWVGKQKEVLEPVRQALAGNGWVVEVQPGDNQEAHYQVAVGRNGEYEISIGTPIKNLGKPLQIGAPEAAEGVVKRLVHLAKYQAVQALDNPASELADYLQFELLDGEKKPFANPSNLTLKQGTPVNLRIKNTSSQPLNIAVLDIQPTWAISQYPIAGEDIFFTLDGQAQIDLRLRPALPKGEGYEEVKETLKLFATRGIANFQWLTLPALDEDLGTKGNLEEQLQKKVDECVQRGESPKVSPLNNLLSTIGADIDQPPELTRAMLYEPEPNAEWLTTQVTFTITK